MILARSLLYTEIIICTLNTHTYISHYNILPYSNYLMFLNLNTIDILGLIIFCYGVCPVGCFISIPGLNSLDATPNPLIFSWKNQNCLQTLLRIPCGEELLLVENTDLEWECLRSRHNFVVYSRFSSESLEGNT